MLRATTILTAVGLAIVVAGCGGGQTVTVVRSTPAQSGPSAPTVSSPTTTAPAPPLPGGRAAVDGRYLTRVRATDDKGGDDIVEDFDEGDESTWPISTECSGETCRVNVRRELKSGAFSTLTLDEVKDRSYAASSTGTTTDCDVGPDVANTKQRLSLRVTAVKDVDGRPTAQRVDAYMTVRAMCANGPASSTISWRGTRLP